VDIPEEAVLLRIHVGEDDRWKGSPLYEALVQKAREDGLAGATVLRGSMGFGAGSVVHTAKVLRLSSNLPIIIEIVDTREKVELFFEHVHEMVGDGLVTLERVQVLKYDARNRAE
jgi:PII-like signaling protein